MADDLKDWDGFFPADAWPTAPCPSCRIGGLHVATDDDTGKQDLRIFMSAAAKREMPTTHFDPNSYYGVFVGRLICERWQCVEEVAINGEWITDWLSSGEFGTYYRLRCAVPAIPLANPPPKTPDEVLKRLDTASRVVWADPGSAANGLRRCVEAVLDHQKVNKTTAKKSGGRQVLTTDARIKLLERKQPVAAAHLMAVKWVGNQGSHGAVETTASECIDSAEHLDSALRILYDTRDAELLRSARAVIRRRGRKPPAKSNPPASGA